MNDIITADEIGKTLKNALQQKVVNNEDTAAVFYNLSLLKEKFDRVKKIFPENALHASAVKACPFTKVLSLIKEWGAGTEAASLPEAYLAEKTGFAGEKIIFDSPAKTGEELKQAVKAGAHINSDSLDELEIIDRLISSMQTGSTFGLRINPQAGTGRILITSVAGEYSKFGVPVKEYRNEIINAYLKYEWLTGIHLHVGSQGCPLELLLKGVGTVYSLAVEINGILAKENKKRRITIFDLGGGIPVNYKGGENAFTVEEYAAALKENFPLLFTEQFKLITEFGRYYFANSAFAVSRIDNIKKQKDITTIISHLGADFFLRRVYNPEFWHHNISLAGKQGNIKSGKASVKYSIGGPLCFAGDILEKEIILPDAEKGDYLVFHDTGAYTYSMWSRYNSRQMPKVLGYYKDDNKFIVLKEREGLEDIYKFWS